MSEITGNTPAAIDFLKNLEPDGPWLLVAINPKPTEGDKKADLGRFLTGQESELYDWIENYQGRWSIYFTSNLPSYTPFSTARKEAVRQIRVIHVDVDLPGAADDKDLEERLLTSVRALSPHPTAIVFTGGGYQAIWKLREKLPAPENTPRIEATNTAIWKTMGGDHCQDVSRLLRLPGTINMPNAKKIEKGRVPTLSYVVEADWTLSWAYDTDPIPSLPGTPLPQGTEKKEESGLVASLPVKLAKLIVSGDASAYDHDRSRLCWRIMCDLIRHGWTDEDISKILLNPRNGASGHYLAQSNPIDYMARNLARARAAVAVDWKRDRRTGVILPRDQKNIDKALGMLRIKLRYDAFADLIWLNIDGSDYRFTDDEANTLWLKIQAECDFLPDYPFFHAVIKARARENSYHPVKDYLNHCQQRWDGVERIGSLHSPSWLSRYGGVEDTPYTRAVGRLTLVAAVRRMRDPGCKFDEMLMLVDPAQGTNKSTAVRTLAVNENWFNDYLPLGEVGREVIEHVRGFWIIEAQELSGMTTRDVERIKGFCSRQADRGRMSYDKLVTDLPRSCIFIGTSNEEILFTDLLNRRYWPVRVLHEFNIELMKLEIHQLWAEAAIAESKGESIRLERDLWPVAAEIQDRYRVEESWATLLDYYLGNLNGRINSIDIYKIINKPIGNVLHNDGRRLGKAMREIGFERKQFRDPNSPNPRWYYYRGQSQEDHQRIILVMRDPITNELSVGVLDESNNQVEDLDTPLPPDYAKPPF